MRIAWGVIVFFILLVPARADKLTVALFTGQTGLGDHSVADAAYTGLCKAQERFDFKLIVEERSRNGVFSPRRLDAVLSECHIAILLSSRSAMVSGLAERYPGTRFIHFEPHATVQPNLRALIFDEDAGAFLAGALAGWMTRSGNVGYLGADRQGQAFGKGVHFADPRVYVRIGAFSEEALLSDQGQELFALAHQWSGSGVDIIFGALPPAGMLLLRTAQGRQGLTIAMDLDMEHPTRQWALSSVNKRLDQVLHQEIIAILEGRFEPGLKHYGLKEEAIQFGYGNAPIPPSVLNKLEELTDRLRSGNFAYPVDLALEHGSGATASPPLRPR
jgi:basic membrane protein A and related proteins